MDSVLINGNLNFGVQSEPYGKLIVHPVEQDTYIVIFKTVRDVTEDGKFVLRPVKVGLWETLVDK